MWCHRLGAVLLVVVSATALRVSFVPAMDGLIQSQIQEHVATLR
ncbi:hypothetical protein [Pseudanabaena sp. FACHB-2040]|nr:hypothetical protein [Pseudanabaena sp. FACHB-2040]